MQNYLHMNISEIAERIFSSRLALVYKLYCRLLESYFHFKRDHYKEVFYRLRYYRLTYFAFPKPEPQAYPPSLRVSPNLISEDYNLIRKALIDSSESKAYRQKFLALGADFSARLKYPRELDFPERQGDLIVLKPFVSGAEKGVLLIKYNDSFVKFLSLYDFNSIAKFYRIVLEPSTWGYQEPIFHSFLGLKTEVIVQSQYYKDYEYIKNIGQNLVPIRLGAGDWVDPNEFKKNEEDNKCYDLIMVASWQRLKRHELLFKALQAIKGQLEKVALVGYPSSGRTLRDIQEEARRWGCLHLLEFHEKIPPSSVRRLMNRAKGNLLLSKREGASKVAYEGFFCDIPLILSSSNIGFNRDHLNSQTGIMAEDRELPGAILHLLSHHASFSPRKWALQNTGCFNSTRHLNNLLRQIALDCGERWTKNLYVKKNMPNLQYVHKEEAEQAESEFLKLKGFLRHFDV